MKRASNLLFALVLFAGIAEAQSTAFLAGCGKSGFGVDLLGD
jgi:hypothetical protein